MTLDTRGPERGLPVFYWKPDEPTFGISVNFGDSLFPLIVERIVKHPVACVHEDYTGPKLIPGGSVLHCARDGDVLWGVGLRTEDDFISNPRFHDVRVAAVRGPITRSFLVSRYGFDVPQMYGDPAVLLPQLFPEWTRRPVKGRVGIVPHFSNRHDYAASAGDQMLILPNRDPQQVVSDILTCELVIAGSLHGLIVAEAYGIPARWINSSRDEPELKYYDYYEGTGRSPRPVRTVSQGLDSGGEPLPRSLNCERLLASFPRDVVIGRA